MARDKANTDKNFEIERRNGLYVVLCTFSNFVSLFCPWMFEKLIKYPTRNNRKEKIQIICIMNLLIAVIHGYKYVKHNQKKNYSQLSDKIGTERRDS